VAVGKKADHTTYDIRYSCETEHAENAASGIAVVT